MRQAILGMALVSMMASGGTWAAMVTKTVEYAVDGKKMASVLVYDDAGAKRPGIVMAPNWMGVNDGQVEKAKRIAGKDYVILIADVYGADLRPKNPEEAGKASKSMYSDRSVLRKRINAALATLKNNAEKAPLDGTHFGAIGFCFGGATVLDLARSGADVAAVVSFHGNLATDDATMAKNIKAKVLAMNGADDTYVPAEQIAAFEKEMRDGGADWQFVNFGGAVHCFAEADAKGEVPGCLYNERAANRSYALMRQHFSEAFAK
ncbi:dienelactone hydrolase family protein [Tahibacter amnicola]|uniref:Dienelactone hydrolase family protein n=1 Tax=Tahibacter amnicola TaxID=2976241 RepID=A0ABY6BB50_9GAMM|nr:dienelactone hydrolase family protein [Tahibacter amnicola]UXI67278.1 dienelactone hydrolase family protein [Tahibacter amnicola]